MVKVMPKKKNPLKTAPVQTDDDDEFGAARPINFHTDGSPISGLEVLDVMAKENKYGKKVFHAFSCGKDSLLAWLIMKEAGFEVIPFYMWRVPELPSTEKKLAYYERAFNTHIYRLPHPDFWYMLDKFSYQPPHRWGAIQRSDLFDFGPDDITELLRQYLKLPEIFCATGVRAVDNITRGMAIRKHGPINWARRVFMPVWDYNKAKLIAKIQESGMTLSPDYRLFGRSFDGLDYRFVKVIRDAQPEDYAVIKRWFPLIWREIVRYDELTKDYPGEN